MCEVHQDPTFWGGALLLTAEFVSAPWPVARGTLEGPFSSCSPAARRRTMKAARLPWNPMDLEQRIGRIHRYGQLHTAQVYNLVLSDTIEGRIFLLPHVISNGLSERR